MAVVIMLIIGIVLGAGMTIIAVAVLSEREGENDEQRGESKGRHIGMDNTGNPESGADDADRGG